MYLFELSNGAHINLEAVATVTEPRKIDPYDKTHGVMYKIILTSGCVHEIYDSIDPPTTPLFGASVYKYSVFLTILKTLSQRGTPQR